MIGRHYVYTRLYIAIVFCLWQSSLKRSQHEVVEALGIRVTPIVVDIVDAKLFLLLKREIVVIYHGISITLFNGNSKPKKRN